MAGIPQGQDFEDLISTLIGEAAGDGDEGMRAVAHVVRNRALASGKNLSTLLRAPEQFDGLTKPTPEILRMQQDPVLRARAANIAARVFMGTDPDPTNGADHFYTGPTPAWAAVYPQTTKIGSHYFHKSGRAPNVSDLGASTRRGMVPTDKKGVVDYIDRNAGRGLDENIRALVENVAAFQGKPVTVTSGYRSPQQNAAVGGARKSQHLHGNAVDVSMRGMNDQQRSELVDRMIERGAGGLITYSGSPDMLHVDLRPQRNGEPLLMFDRSSQSIAAAPEWFRAKAAAMKNDKLYPGLARNTEPAPILPVDTAPVPELLPDRMVARPLPHPGQIIPATPLPHPGQTQSLPDPGTYPNAEPKLVYPTDTLPPLVNKGYVETKPVVPVDYNVPPYDPSAPAPAPAATPDAPAVAGDPASMGIGNLFAGLGQMLGANAARNAQAEADARAAWLANYRRTLGPSPMQIASQMQGSVPKMELPQMLPAGQRNATPIKTKDQILSELFGRPLGIG